MIALAVVRGVGADELSLATASNRTSLQLGNAVGIAVIVAVLGETTGPEALANFRRSWELLAALAVVSLVAVALMGSTTRTATRTRSVGPRERERRRGR
jgi:uncharacterized membrane protein